MAIVEFAFDGPSQPDGLQPAGFSLQAADE
jgi:hypothetical protein